MKHFKFEMLFKDDDVCRCGSLILKAHREFLFFRQPLDCQMHKNAAEWRPHIETPPIPGDRGPERVAYWHEGKPTVQVFNDPDEGMWKACFSYTETRNGLPFTMWVCKMRGPEQPCDEEFMREISS